MPESVVARVADRLEIRAEQTDRVLRTLAQLIKKQSARDGHVRVPGLGVFQLTADAIDFEPDPALAEAINVRYADLEPVPLSLSTEVEAATPEILAPEMGMSESVAEASGTLAPPIPQDLEQETAAEAAEEEPAFVESATDDVLEDETLPAKESIADTDFEEAPRYEEDEEVSFEETDEAFVDEGGEEPSAMDADDEPEGLPLYAAQQTDYDDPDLSEATAYEQLVNDAGDVADEDTVSQWETPGPAWSKSDLDALLEERFEKEETSDDEVSAQAREDEAALQEEEEVEAFFETLPDEDDGLPPPLPPAQPKSIPSKKTRRRSPMIWLMLIGAVLVIGFGILYLLDFPGFSSTNPAASPALTEETTPAVIPEAAPTEAETPVDDAPSPTGAGETPTETPSNTPPEDTPAVTETPAASGQGIDLNQGGYTLIVASFPQRAVAEAEAEKFRQRLNDSSLPIEVLAGDSSGGTRYRVAIGQVPTLEEATALLSSLSSNLPEGSWIKRITTDGS